jgi:hypothetical protein
MDFPVQFHNSHISSDIHCIVLYITINLSYHKHIIKIVSSLVEYLNFVREVTNYM